MFCLLMAATVAACGSPANQAGEADPIFTASPVAQTSTEKVAQWDEAYAWGDHAQAGYLRSESEAQFMASAAAAISLPEVASWNQAAAWGDHRDAGYLQAELDPLFSQSPAAAITSGAMAEWTTAATWGDHRTAGYLTAEVEPRFSASPASAVTAQQVESWAAAYSWGNHATRGYLKTESDPQFNASVAKGITSANLANWSSAYGWGDHATQGYLKTESDPKVGANTSGGVPRWDGTALVTGSLFDDGTNVGIGTASPNSRLQVGGSGLAVDQFMTSFNSGSVGADVWQSFLANKTGNLMRVTFQTNSCPSVVGTMTIYSGEGLSGTLLATQAFTLSEVCNAFFNVDFATPAAVAAGGSYTFRIQTSGETFFHLVNSSNPYAGGIYHSIDYGSTPSWDMVFKTWVAQAPTLAVTDTGMVGVGIAPLRPLHVNDLMRLEPRNGPPSDPGAGDLYYDKSLAKLRYFNGTSWISL